MVSVYCFLGYPGSGKSVASTLATERSLPVFSMGDIVRERANEALGCDATGSAIGEFATAQRDEHGVEVFAHAICEEIHSEADDAERIVIDGVRTPEELAVFEEEFDEVHTVFITASFETRLSRLQERGREDEGSMTEQDLIERDAREDSWGVARVLQRDDYQTIENESSLDSFKEQVAALLQSSEQPA